MTRCLKDGRGVLPVRARARVAGQRRPCVQVPSTLRSRWARWRRGIAPASTFPSSALPAASARRPPRKWSRRCCLEHFNTHKTRKRTSTTSWACPRRCCGWTTANEVSCGGDGHQRFRRDAPPDGQMVHPTIAVMQRHRRFPSGIFSTTTRACCAPRAEIFESMGAGRSGDPQRRRRDCCAHWTIRPSRPPDLRPAGGQRRSWRPMCENLGAAGRAAAPSATQGGEFDVQTFPPTGVHMVYAALAGRGGGPLALGIDGRGNRRGDRPLSDGGRPGAGSLHTPNGLTIVSDCYNANPNSTSRGRRILCGC